MRSEIICNVWLGMWLDVLRKHSGIVVQLTSVHTMLMKVNIRCLWELGRLAEGKGPLVGPRLLAPGSRIISVLAQHTESYKTVALGEGCLSTPWSQCPDVSRLLHVEVTWLETQWGTKG